MTQSSVKTGRVMGSLIREAKMKSAMILGLAAALLTTTSLRADSDSDGNDREGKQLAGTWVGNAGSTLAPALASFMADGRVIFSRPVAVPTGPGIFELASTGHGEWKRTGDHAYVSTVLVLRSGPNVEFTGLVKLVLTINLNRTSDQLEATGTVFIYGADGSLLATFPQPGVGVFKRIVAGE